MKGVMWMTEGTPAMRASKSSSGMTWQRSQAEAALEEEVGAQSQEGTPNLTPILPGSEPDLITAYTGHSIDIAQHWEPDETCKVKDAVSLSEPHCLGVGRPLSAPWRTRGLCHKHKAWGAEEGGHGHLSPYLGW